MNVGAEIAASQRVGKSYNTDDLWRTAPLRHSAVLVQRPSYGGRASAAGTGSDSVDHEVFWFDKLWAGRPYTRSRFWWERARRHPLRAPEAG